MDRVIFRTEKDPYISEQRYVAVFPDYSARPGHISCLSFFFSYDDMEKGYVWFDCWDEMSEGYYTTTKLIHKNTPIAARCKEVVEEYMNQYAEYEGVTKLKVVERRNPYGRRRNVA